MLKVIKSCVQDSQFCFYIEIILCRCAVQLNFLGWNLQSVRKVPGLVYMLNVFGMGTHEYFLSMLQHLVQGQNPCNSKLVKHPILLGILDIQKSTTHYKRYTSQWRKLQQSAFSISLQFKGSESCEKKLTQLNGCMRL